MLKRRCALVTRLLCCVVLCLLLGSVPAQATQILLQTPSEMGASSELVFQGQVSGVRSFWNESGTKILTEVHVDIARAHKGAARTSVRILQLGGEVDGVKMSVAGSLAWRLGEEVLLFVEPMKGDAYRVAGFSQGKFLVEHDSRGESFVRRPALVDTQLMASAGMEAPHKMNTELRVPLDQFLSESLPEYRLQDREED